MDFRLPPGHINPVITVVRVDPGEDPTLTEGTSAAENAAEKNHFVARSSNLANPTEGGKIAFLYACPMHDFDMRRDVLRIQCWALRELSDDEKESVAKRKKKPLTSSGGPIGNEPPGYKSVLLAEVNGNSIFIPKEVLKDTTKAVRQDGELPLPYVPGVFSSPEATPQEVPRLLIRLDCSPQQ